MKSFPKSPGRSQKPVTLAASMSDKERIAALERALRNVPGYIDNWEWAEENFDILKTIPGYHFPNVDLAERRRKEKEEAKEQRK